MLKDKSNVIKKKAENEELFLKEHAERQKQCDQKKKAENEELFLNEHAKRQKRSDQKKKDFQFQC